jgi:hypothetical protein
MIDNVIKNIKYIENKSVTFLTGAAGPFALGAVIHHLQQHEQESEMMISK